MSFSVAAGTSLTSVTVSGSGGAPQVTVTGPDGQGLSDPSPGRGAVAKGIVALPMAKLDQTMIGIDNPAAGQWTITPLPGSPPITKVTYAEGLPPAHICATVSSDGTERALSYHVRPRALVRSARHATRQVRWGGLRAPRR